MTSPQTKPPRLLLVQVRDTRENNEPKLKTSFITVGQVTLHSTGIGIDVRVHPQHSLSWQDRLIMADIPQATDNMPSLQVVRVYKPRGKPPIILTGGTARQGRRTGMVNLSLGGMPPGASFALIPPLKGLSAAQVRETLSASPYLREALGEEGIAAAAAQHSR